MHHAGAGLWETVLGAACLAAAAVFLARARRAPAHRSTALGHGAMAAAMGAMAAGRHGLSAVLAAVSCLLALVGRGRGESSATETVHSCAAAAAMVLMPLLPREHDGLPVAVLCLALTGYFAVRTVRWWSSFTSSRARAESAAHLVMGAAMTTTFLAMV